MRDDRVGLCMIAASLGVIVLITGLLLQEQLEARRDQARVQGVSLVRLLSRIPYHQLLPSGGQKGPLEVVKHAQGSPDFAYASIVTSPKVSYQSDENTRQ